MDDITYNLLQKMALDNAELISLREFEDPALAQAKTTRTWAEYCWTCTASLVLFLLKKYPHLEMMTYLDADLFFYNSPESIFEEFGEKSIFITEHNPSKEFQRLLIYGIYNVQFVMFRNDNNGLQALEWWRDKTIKKCYSRRRGKNMQGGDQIYLNDWPTRFENVHVLQNKRLCLAPWNVNKYQITSQNNTIYVDNKEKLVFFHFHSLEINNENKFILADGAYRINKNVQKLIYQPYIETLKREIRLVKSLDPSFKYGYSKRTIKKYIKYWIKKLIYTRYRCFN